MEKIGNAQKIPKFIFTCILLYFETSQDKALCFIITGVNIKL